jgi:hypothetical protein
MTPEQEKLAYELITNPPPGSKLAAAKASGVDLTLLLENLKLTPTERAQAFAWNVRRLKALNAAGIEISEDLCLTSRDLDVLTERLRDRLKLP